MMGRGFVVAVAAPVAVAVTIRSDRSVRRESVTDKPLSPSGVSTRSPTKRDFWVKSPEEKKEDFLDWGHAQEVLVPDDHGREFPPSELATCFAFTESTPTPTFVKVYNRQRKEASGLLDSNSEEDRTKVAKNFLQEYQFHLSSGIAESPACINKPVSWNIGTLDNVRSAVKDLLQDYNGERTLAPFPWIQQEWPELTGTHTYANGVATGYDQFPSVSYPMATDDLQKMLVKEEQLMRNGDNNIGTMEEFFNLATSLLSAIDYSHSAMRYMHGDIKPENILFYDEPGDGRYRLIDFGAAVKLNSDDPAFFCKGDPQYYPNCHRPSAAADVYAVGQVLSLFYHMIGHKDVPAPNGSPSSHGTKKMAIRLIKSLTGRGRQAPMPAGEALAIALEGQKMFDTSTNAESKEDDDDDEIMRMSSSGAIGYKPRN